MRLRGTRDYDQRSAKRGWVEHSVGPVVAEGC